VNHSLTVSYIQQLLNQVVSAQHSICLSMIPVSGEFVVSLKEIDFGMFSVEHLERTVRFVHFRLARRWHLVSRQRQWRQRYYILLMHTTTRVSEVDTTTTRDSSKATTQSMFVCVCVCVCVCAMLTLRRRSTASTTMTTFGVQSENKLSTVNHNTSSSLLVTGEFRCWFSYDVRTCH